MFNLFGVVPLSRILGLALLCSVGTSYAVPITKPGLNPTKPLTAGSKNIQSPQVKKGLVLESIIHGNKVHTAVINGQALKANDTIGEYKLVAVNDNSVVLRSSEKRLKLYIFSQKITK